jgi:O-antigen/teichoic acid export membrane protein
LAKFTRTVILARLLTPDDFGIMGLALLAVSTLQSLTSTGFTSALVQKDEDIQSDLDTAWTFTALRGLMLAAVIALGAPYVSTFFDAAEATPVVRAVAISVLLTGLENVGVVYFQKELHFGKHFVFQVVGVIADLVVAVLFAFLLRTVWALVLGLLAERVVRLVASYLIHPYRPRLRFDRSSASRLFSYGKRLSLSYVLMFIGAHGDDAVVGKVIGTAALGTYQLAYRLSQLAVTETTYVIERAAFPAYAKLQGEGDRLRSAYFRIASVSFALSVPIASAIAILGGDFVRIFLGYQWLPMIPVVRVLAVAALIKSVVSTGSPLFKGVGRPQYEFQMQLARAATVAVLVVPMSIRWGIVGAAAAVLLSTISMLVVWYLRTSGQLHPQVREWIGAFGPPAVSATAMVGALWLSGRLNQPLLSGALGTPVIRFVVTACVGVAAYAGVFYVTQPRLSEHQLLEEAVRALKG